MIDGGRVELRRSLMRMRWLTVSNALERSSAVMMARWGGSLWFSPLAMSVVKRVKSVAVECPGRKPCW